MFTDTELYTLGHEAGTAAKGLGEHHEPLVSEITSQLEYLRTLNTKQTHAVSTAWHDGFLAATKVEEIN